MSKQNIRQRIIIKSWDPWWDFNNDGYKRNGAKVRTKLKRYLDKLEEKDNE